MEIEKSIISETLGSPLGEAAYHVAEILHDNGYEAWWVGGCVRDMYLGKEPKDVDIATSAKPEEVSKLFPKSDDSAALLGGVLVSHKGHVFEVTTFREEDDRSDGRTPETVTFSDREHDAARRDITVNALYWNPINSEVYDPFDAEKDLKESLIRVIGDPKIRFQHDALRLLRIIRFRALLDGQYHPNTFAALHSEAKLVEGLSGTRVFQELEKILLGPNPQIAFEDMWETDVLEYLLPELHACKGVAQPEGMHEEGDVWNHEMQVIASFTDDHTADVRFAALFHDIGKPKTFSIDEDRIRFNEHAPVGGEITEKVLERMQCPAQRRNKIVWLVEHHMMMSTFFEIDNERKSHWYYHPWFTELLQLFWLDAAGTTPTDFSLYERIIDDYNHFLDENPRPQKSLLSGDEVMELLGLPPGEKVGEILQKMHAAQIRKEITTKQEAKDFISRVNL